MDAPEALAALPRPYSLALRLRAAGVEDRLIADCLGVELEAVPALLEIAAAKLDASTQRRQEHSPAPPGGPPPGSSDPPAAEAPDVAP